MFCKCFTSPGIIDPSASFITWQIILLIFPFKVRNFIYLAKNLSFPFKVIIDEDFYDSLGSVIWMVNVDVGVDEVDLPNEVDG